MVGRTRRVCHAAQNESGQDGVYQGEAAGDPVGGRMSSRFFQYDPVGGTRYPRRWMRWRAVVRGASGLSLFSEQILKNLQSIARLGARTTGIDASEANIGIASTHAAGDPQFARSTESLKYLHTTAEVLLGEGKQYDVVCSMEVIEHVNAPAEFLHVCAQLVKVRDSFRFLRTPLIHAFATHSFQPFSPEVTCFSPPSHARPWPML